MQFHLNGFEPGDPEIAKPVGKTAAQARRDGLPEEVDVLIVGCGPAGLTLAAQLSLFPEIRTRIIERKPKPLEMGQADGIACRTIEMFQAFKFAEKIVKEACWITETTFWKPDADASNRIVRSGRVQDVEDGLSQFPHVILNQARVHDRYLEVMRNGPHRLQPDYSCELIGLEIDDDAQRDDQEVVATIKQLDSADDTGTATVRAKYVVGCDGARSVVRKLIGRSLRGEAANQAWGVMDILAVTDFPDVRMKSLIQSAEEGNILLIPREGGYLFRIYVEIDKLAEDERVASKNISVDYLIAAAQRILQPYTLDVKEVVWWSVYEIGQRLCDRFDDVSADAVGKRSPRVFICGDACHTHSPKAGQGMNVSMQDAFNLGWKLASVLEGRATRDLLLTYSEERQAAAKELIDFDREWASMLSAPLRSAANPDGVDPLDVEKYFVQHGRYTAGVATHYARSMITGADTHQHLATGFPVGMRFHSAPVVRFADAMPFHLGHTIEADGRWRIIAFADACDPGDPRSRLRTLCEFLAGAEESPVNRYTPVGADPDAVIDFRAVFQQHHQTLELDRMPRFLLPEKGQYGLTDREKIFCADLKPGLDIFELRGIDREKGCMVLVRPDQYVAHVLPLDGFEALSEFFREFMVPPRD